MAEWLEHQQAGVRETDDLWPDERHRSRSNLWRLRRRAAACRTLERRLALVLADDFAGEAAAPAAPRERRRSLWAKADRCATPMEIGDPCGSRLDRRGRRQPPRASALSALLRAFTPSSS